MSPLACSLLAFVALFAATDALKPANPWCDSLPLGKNSKDQITFTEHFPGGVHQLPDKCTRPGRQLVGTFITACNMPNSKPKLIPAVMDHEIIPNFTLIKINCPSHIPGCDKVEVVVDQYCDMVTAPH